MAKNARALVASVVLVACGGGNDTLFAKGSPGGGGSDAGPSAGSTTSNGGSSGNASGNGGNNAGGSSATGGRAASGGQSGSPQTDGSMSAGGTMPADGSADGSNGGAPDGSADSSAGGSGGSSGASGAAGASTGGRAGSGGRGGAGGANTGGRGGAGGPGTGGKGGAAGDGGTLKPTPGVIACAGSDCTIAGVPTNVCCVSAVLFPTACFPSFPGCGVTASTAFACDDAADCTNANICCRSSLGANCAKTCGSGQAQLCRTNDECVAGACRPLAQAPTYSSCQ